MSLENEGLLVKVVFRAALLCCVINFTTGEFSLSTENYRGGIFIKCTPITLVCKNQPYSGFHAWNYGTEKMTECISSTCLHYKNKSGFHFDHDTTKGIFRWRIDPVEVEYKDQIFECYNGSKTQSLTGIFDDAGWESYNYAIVIVVILAISIIAAVITTVITTKLRGSGNNEVRFRTICVCRSIILFNIIGVFLTFALILAVRFGKGSVDEIYQTCCWAILLITLSIYTGLLFALVIVTAVVRYNFGERSWKLLLCFDTP